jgi:hypothetical protein
MIHDGMFFNASGIVTGIAAGANFDILIQMPAGTFGHLTLVEYSVESGPVDLKFYEDSTVSATGTLVNVRNHNRVNPTDASNADVYHTPTITDIGTLLHERYIPASGAGGTSGLLVSGEDSEWVLGDPVSAKNYVWRLTNNDTGSIRVGFHFNGYELGYQS